MKRVALVRRGYSATGGAERYLLRLATGLVARGRVPVLVTTAAWPDAAWPHGPIHRLPGGSPRRFADAVAAALPGFGCDHVFSLERIHTCDTYRAGDGVHAAWLARRAATEPRWKSAFRAMQPKHRHLLALERQLFSGGAARVIVNSKLVAGEIQRHFHTPPDRIHLVYNGYDLPVRESSDDPGHGRQSTREHLGIPGSAVMALFTGSGWARKGLAHAIQAMREIDHPDLHLVVAGAGKPTAGLRHPRVHFPGPVLDMAPLYAAADFFILPTLYDPFSNACLEAARHGLPVVTTRANGFAEWIEDEINGSVVEAGDIIALARAMKHWTEPLRAMEARAHCAAHVSGLTVAANTDATLAAVLG